MEKMSEKEILISSVKVSEIFKDCLEDNEDSINDNSLIVEGIVHKFAFNASKIENYKQSIIDLINCLPNKFKEGYSFLNLCEDKEGSLWGEQFNAEQLMCLGIAIGKIKILLPREIWYALPGGVPYLQVLN